MTHMTPAQALDAALRAHHGRIMAALIARVGAFQLAEDALQDAAQSALVHWPRGIPARPEAWLIRVAFRKAIDRLRRAARDSRQAQALAVLARDGAADDPEMIADERLRLIFTCCHPALDPKSRVALTLRTLGGLTTAEIARAFLDEEPTMGQRLSRAKAKIAAAGIPFAVPEPEDWPARMGSVLAVIYLIFNEGYAASTGDAHIRAGLCDEAIWLARMVQALAPADAEVAGALALMLLTDARRAARTDLGGAMVTLDQQDRHHWDAAMIAEGTAVLDHALTLRAPGPYQIKAAIAALHAAAPAYHQTDWPQVLALYDALLAFEPTDVVRLNRAVVRAEVAGAAIALQDVRRLAPGLDGYQPYHATLADLLARLGDSAAGAEYDRAIALSGTAAQRDFLRERKALLAINQKKGRDDARPSPTGR